MEDIRWIQRFRNHNKSLDQIISEAVALDKERTLSELEKQGPHTSL